MRFIAKSLATLAVTVIVSLAVGEVALRAMGFSAPIFYRPDAELGWTMRPGAKG